MGFETGLGTWWRARRPQDRPQKACSRLSRDELCIRRGFRELWLLYCGYDKKRVAGVDRKEPQ